MADTVMKRNKWANAYMHTAMLQKTMILLLR